MSGVLVFGDIAEGGLAPESLQVAAAGAGLAEALGEPLVGALAGEDLATACGEFNCGLSSLYVVEGSHFRSYNAGAWLAAANAVLEACAPSVALFAHTLATREWVPRLAAALDTGLVMDCTALAAEGKDLVVTKPVYGGAVLGEFVVHGSPKMATVRAAGFEPRSGPAPAALVRVPVAALDSSRVALLDQVAATAASGPKLKDAKIIVSGGRGLGGRDNWHLVEETAAVLGAAVGCSRPVADAGWVPSSHQVGLSGTSVTPDLYVAVGISGAVQHLAGISAAKTVVAINVDPEADIFTRANYGVVGDCREVLPAFVERIKQLR